MRWSITRSSWTAWSSSRTASSSAASAGRSARTVTRKVPASRIRAESRTGVGSSSSPRVEGPRLGPRPLGGIVGPGREDRRPVRQRDLLDRQPGPHALQPGEPLVAERGLEDHVVLDQDHVLGADPLHPDVAPGGRVPEGDRP